MNMAPTPAGSQAKLSRFGMTWFRRLGRVLINKFDMTWFRRTGRGLVHNSGMTWLRRAGSGLLNKFGMTWFRPLRRVLARKFGMTWIAPTAAVIAAIAAISVNLIPISASQAHGEGTGQPEVHASDVALTGEDRVISFSNSDFAFASEQIEFVARNGNGNGSSAIAREIGRLHSRRITGEGIDVAIIDTGVSPVAGLDMHGKVLYGPDLSHEGSLENLATLDTYGHGTHLAGVIAGNDSNGFVGVAPDARLVSLKIAGADGDTSIAQAIAAIEWVIEHRNTDGLNIRVLNLSFGIDAVGDSTTDPLSAVVERAWDAGIVVVAAVGNRGNDANGVDSPAISPYVIAVAGGQSADAIEGVGPWSSGGDGTRDPDVVSDGESIVSLRVPGSSVAIANPRSKVDARFSKGTGTSQAAAVVSGSVALMLSARPTLTPNEVKYLLLNTAHDLSPQSTRLDGSGFIRPQLAVNRMFLVRWRNTDQLHPRALGITNWDGVDSWSGGAWNGATWSGATWSGATWSGATWSGATWSGATWSGATWSGATWSSPTTASDVADGIDWSQARWSGTGWDHSGNLGGPERAAEADVVSLEPSGDSLDYKDILAPTATATPTQRVPLPTSDGLELTPESPSTDAVVLAPPATAVWIEAD